jgi:hypothetical protein
MVGWLLSHPRRPSPVARFQMNRSTGVSPLEVVFDGSGSTAPGGTGISTYKWDFDDGGARGDGAVAPHVYERPGRRQARLRVITEDDRISLPVSETVIVTCPSGSLDPWTGTDIGSPLFPGGARPEEGGCYAICAGGTGIGSSRDQIYFLSRMLTGNFSLTVKVTDLDLPRSSAGISLMVRESPEADSPFAGIVLQWESAKIVARFRTRPGSAKKVADAILPFWLRLARKGSEGTFYVSADGETWTAAGQRTLDGPILAGIAATGKDTGKEGQSYLAFRAGVCLSLEILPESGRIHPGDATLDGALDLSDAIWLVDHLFLGNHPALPCEGGSSSSPGPGDLALADVNGDGKIDISDPVSILSFLFIGSGPPALGMECVPIFGCPEACR